MENSAPCFTRIRKNIKARSARTPDNANRPTTTSARILIVSIPFNLFLNFLPHAKNY